MNRLFPSLLLMAACSPDPFLEVEEAWVGSWNVERHQEDEGCDPLTTVDARYRTLELDLPAIDGVFLEALGCNPGGCDELPWLLMPLEEATAEELFGRSLLYNFFVGEDGLGSCEVQSGVLDATLADGLMVLELRTFSGGFEAGGYDECETIAEQVVDELCTQSLRYTATR